MENRVPVFQMLFILEKKRKKGLKKTQEMFKEIYFKNENENETEKKYILKH